MGQVHFVIGHRVEIGDIDGVSFTGTKDGKTLRFVVTREALEALAGHAGHGSALLDMFDGWKERIWRLAERKVPARLYEDGNYLITEEDVLGWTPDAQ